MVIRIISKMARFDFTKRYFLLVVPCFLRVDPENCLTIVFSLVSFLFATFRLIRFYIYSLRSYLYTNFHIYSSLLPLRRDLLIY